MEYYFGSTSVIDNFYYANNTEKTGNLGGAGLYAFSGAKLWSDRTHIVCGVGDDYFDLFSRWYEINKVDQDTIYIVDDKTPVNIMYFQEGYPDKKMPIEIPFYGYDHYKKFEMTVFQFTQLARKNCCIYIFKDTSMKFWQNFIEMNHRKALVLWEINDQQVNAENLQEFEKIIKHVDALSISYTAAKKLFGVYSDTEVISRIKEYNISTVLIKHGFYSVYLIHNNIETEIVYEIVRKDGLTGIGNAASGALLVGLGEEKVIEEIEEMIKASVKMISSTLGVPGDIISYREKG